LASPVRGGCKPNSTRAEDQAQGPDDHAPKAFHRLLVLIHFLAQKNSNLLQDGQQNGKAFLVSVVSRNFTVHHSPSRRPHPHLSPRKRANDAIHCSRPSIHQHRRDEYPHFPVGSVLLSVTLAMACAGLVRGDFTAISLTAR
jgi:hypothetical protein